MKKIIITLFLLFGVCSTYANEDYTLIDCIDGDDTTGKVFDSSKPYMSLKEGIESTISYINSNYNKSGEEETASGKVFNIKVNCSTNTIGQNTINLNFDGFKYNNQLIIEGSEENSFVVSDIYFSSRISKDNYTNGSNITFRNAMFLNPSEYGYYFNNVSSIKILNSYIKLTDKSSIGINRTYTYYNRKYSYFLNAINVEKSKIDIDLENNYKFGLPAIVKDTEITFNNIDKSEKYDIEFFQHNPASYIQNGFIKKVFLISNEIDLGGNNFLASNSINLVFLNNKFTNFSDFIFGFDKDKNSSTVFVNNYIENNSELDITNYKNLYNNIFLGGYNSLYDLFNLRRNFSFDDDNNNFGLGWIFKIKNKFDFFDISIDNFSLYEEVTGEEIEKNKKGVYLIYN